LCVDEIEVRWVPKMFGKIYHILLLKYNFFWNPLLWAGTKNMGGWNVHDKVIVKSWFIVSIYI